MGSIMAKRYNSEQVEKALELINLDMRLETGQFREKALYLGESTKQDKESARKKFEYVYEHGEHALLVRMFMLHMDHDDDSMKVMIVNALQKAKREIQELEKIDKEIAEEEKTTRLHKHKNTPLAIAWRLSWVGVS